MATQTVGYITLLRCNSSFRLLWFGQIVSQLGDWLDAIALYTLLYRLTGSGQAIGALVVVQFLPSTITCLFSGVVVDRLPRKLVLVATDLGRGLLVLLFLLVQDAHNIWLIYAVTALKVILASFFEPARSAALPMILRREDLVVANALVGVTWAATVALGAGIGGLVTGIFGTDIAFLLDSATFFLSAALLVQMQMADKHLDKDNYFSPLHDFVEGIRYMFSQLDIAVYVMSKALWSLGGGVFVLLTLFGQKVFPIGIDGALSTGVLFAARGIGSAIGLIFIENFDTASLSFLRRSIGLMMLATAIGYAICSVSPTLIVVMIGVMFAHMGGGVLWAFSTSLIHLSVPQRLHGRIFAVELALMTLTTALSSFVIGTAADAGWHPRLLGAAIAGMFAIPGFILLILLWHSSSVVHNKE